VKNGRRARPSLSPFEGGAPHPARACQPTPSPGARLSSCRVIAQDKEVVSHYKIVSVDCRVAQMFQQGGLCLGEEELRGERGVT